VNDAIGGARLSLTDANVRSPRDQGKGGRITTALRWNYSQLSDEKFLIQTMNDQQQQTIINKTPHFGVANRGNNLARLASNKYLPCIFR
jgi:hypothetical protein